MTAAAKHACFNVRDLEETEAGDKVVSGSLVVNREVMRTGKGVGHIVGTDHVGIEAGEDGADGEEVVPVVKRHLELRS